MSRSPCCEVGNVAQRGALLPDCLGELESMRRRLRPFSLFILHFLLPFGHYSRFIPALSPKEYGREALFPLITTRFTVGHAFPRVFSLSARFNRVLPRVGIHQFCSFSPVFDSFEQKCQECSGPNPLIIRPKREDSAQNG